MTLYEADGRRGLKTHKELLLKDLSMSIIKFSRSGNYFAIIKKFENEEEDDELLVFDSEDMMVCFDDIDNNNPLFSKKLNKEANGESELIQFDLHDQFVAVSSKNTIQMFSTQPGSMG